MTQTEQVIDELMETTMDEPASAFDACNHALAYARETLLILPQPTSPLDRQAFDRMVKYIDEALELAAATGVEPRHPICGGNNYCTKTAATAISALDWAWAAINAQGGPLTTNTSSYDHGIIDGIGKALEEIEKLGGSDPVARKVA